MSDAIQSAALAQTTNLAPNERSEVGQTAGLFRGEQVTVQPASTQSILQDAAEEISMFHGERSSKDLAKRKATDKNGRAQELAQKYIQQVPDIGQPEKFHQLGETLKKQAGSITPETLRQLLKEEFEDVSHQYAALEYLDELLSETGDAPELLEAVREARGELDEHHGPEIRAGLNVTGTAIRFEQLDGPQNLRDFYRETILAFEDVTEAHSSILARYGESNFDAAAEFLIHAVGDDLSSAGPSMEPRQLKATMDNLYMVQVARNVHVQLDGLFQKMADEFNLTPSTSSSQILSELLPLKDQRWVDGNKIDAITNRLGALSHEPKIYFLRELGGIVRDLPEKIYQSGDARDRLRDAIQESLDRAIDLEGL